MPQLDPSDLRTFLAVAGHLSFSRAAVDLGVSPSALSHSIRALEERAGVRLLNRTTRSVSLTEAGQLLFDRVSPAFRDITDAIEDLNSFRGRPAGSLRINAPRLACELVLLPMLARFLAAYPDIRVEVVSDNTMTDVVGAGFDAGIRLGHALEPDMIAVPFGPQMRSAVVASRAFFKGREKPQHPRDLQALPCIRYRFQSGVMYEWEFEKRGREIRVAVEGPLTVGSQDLMIEPALGGAGLAYVFESQVERHLADGSLVRVLEDWCPPYPGFFLYYPGRRQLPGALRAFVDFIRTTR